MMAILVSCHFLTAAQSVKIATIDIYGNRSYTSDQIRNMIPVKEGDSVDQQTFLDKVIQKKLDSLPGVLRVSVTPVCCFHDFDYNLYVGIAESDSAILLFRASPNLRIKLPAKYTSAYAAFSEKLTDAVEAQQASEDWDKGHSLIQYAPARKLQEKFVAWAKADFTLFRKIIRSSAYSDQRATAAQIIAYHPDKKRVLPELLYAMHDENDEVRNNAIRALAVIAYYSTLHPELNLNIPHQPFVRLLNSVVWSDRNKGVSVLMQLSKSRDQQLFDQLKRDAMPALKEMTLWKDRKHAMPAFVILARINGLSDDNIFKAAADSNFNEQAKRLVQSF